MKTIDLSLSIDNEMRGVDQTLMIYFTATAGDIEPIHQRYGREEVCRTVEQFHGRMGRLDPDRISKIDALGNLVSGDKPSKEAFLHHSVYRVRDDSNSIVHLHSTRSVAVSVIADIDPADVFRSDPRFNIGGKTFEVIGTTVDFESCFIQQGESAHQVL